MAAWTVWVPEFDREAVELLEAAGHVFDGSPMAMSVELEGFERPRSVTSTGTPTSIRLSSGASTTSPTASRDPRAWRRG